MQINPEIIEELILDAGEARAKKARNYKQAKKVIITETKYEDQNNFEVKAEVYGTETYNTYIEVKKGEIEDITCTCPDYQQHYGVCKHSLATILELRDKNETAKKEQPKKIIDKNEAKYRSFRQIVNTFYNEEIDDIAEDEETTIKNKGTIKIEPKIYFDRFTGEMKAEFKIGEKRLYKIKELSEFYDRIMNKTYYKYGDKLQFIHTKEAFSEESQKLLEFILKYAEIIKYANASSNSTYHYYGKALSDTSIMLSNTGIDDLFEIIKGKEIRFQRDGIEENVEFIDKDPNLKFKLNKEKDEYVIQPNQDIFKMNIIRGKTHKYILKESEFYRLSSEFEKTKLKLLNSFRQNYVSELHLAKDDLMQLFSVIMPKIKNAIKLGNVSEEEIEEYKPKELGVKVFLDFDKNDYIIADVKFCYGETEFNPLEEKQDIQIPRNMVEEAKALNIFRRTGFMFDVQNTRFILPDNDKIYEFLTQDIETYMQKFEVMATDNFKTKQVTKPKIGSIGVKVENDLLKIDFSQIEFNLAELKDIMNQYKLKKKYHRLKDGTFIELEENKEIEFFDQILTGMDLDYKDIEEGEIDLPINRSLYLNQLLKGIKGTEIVKNQEYKKIVNKLNQEQLEEEYELPKTLNAKLRYYQKTGYTWLKILDNYKFGGILADDMGLGKTIQILAIILNYIEETKKEKTESTNKKETENKEEAESKNTYNTEKQKERKTSIVISPSSLTLNWLNEAQKFAPNLQVKVISGKASERKEQIENLEKYDIIITSYDLLKRDIEAYKQKAYTFKFAITDEAQYLKNSNTQNAKAVKQIKAQTKYALTGTPIENSLAELWSIFDFIMPGYLFRYKKFKNTYEGPIVKENDEIAMKKLKMLIEPFVLRRTKKEVLTELPEKTITILNNEMNDEQKNIYLSYLAQAKEEVAEEININGIEKSQIKILSALTRLRQICCHPKIFIENYEGTSSKLEQCMEIVEDATESGHKILIFSTYTSMFEIMEQQLKEQKIPYYKLTGSTKVDERIKMVDEFNTNQNIKVFLISLKAGGTGLNLTGADMVIHYDPWWNLSAENQATDRAYRIGQKNNVQVYKLITKNTIEEKIYELQMKKAELAENMLSTQTKFINKLSKDEIMKLFS